MKFGVALTLALVLVGLCLWFVRYRRTKRQDFIRDYSFPAQVTRRLFQAYPDLTNSQQQQVLAALKTYFMVVAMSGAARRGFLLGMPSKAVDQAWHAFILETRAYAAFCQQAFGAMLHHTGFEDGSNRVFDALYNTWAWAAKLPGGHAASSLATRLFTTDTNLAIANPFIADMDALKNRFEARRAHREKTGAGSGGAGCGAACAEFGGSDSGGSDGGADGGSDGGGDGGGCGGGGD
jgi:hypothetical protein